LLSLPALVGEKREVNPVALCAPSSPDKASLAAALGVLKVNVIPGNPMSLVLEANLDKLVADLRMVHDEAMNHTLPEGA
jgi:hypothetical protein